MATVEQIIARMEDANESQEDIALVVNEFENQEDEKDKKKKSTVYKSGSQLTQEKAETPGAFLGTDKENIVSDDGFLVQPYGNVETVQDRVYTQGQQVIDYKTQNPDPSTYLGQTYENYKTEGVHYGDVQFGVSEHFADTETITIDGIMKDAKDTKTIYRYTPDHPNYGTKGKRAFNIYNLGIDMMNIAGDDEVEEFEKKLHQYTWDQKALKILPHVLSEDDKNHLINNPELYINSREDLLREVETGGLPIMPGAEDVAGDYTLDDLLDYRAENIKPKSEEWWSKNEYRFNQKLKEKVQPEINRIENELKEEYSVQIQPLEKSIIDENQKLFSTKAEPIYKSITDGVLKQLLKEVKQGKFEGWSEDNLNKEFERRQRVSFEQSKDLKALDEKFQAAVNAAIDKNPKLQALYKTMNDELNKRIGKNKEVNDFIKAHNDYIDISWQKHAKTLETDFSLIPKQVYKKVNNELDEMGFWGFTHKNKERALNNMWHAVSVNLLKQNPEMETQDLLGRQTEFFAKYYSDLERTQIGVNKETGEKQYGLSDFIIRDYAEHTLAHAQAEYQTAKFRIERLSFEEKWQVYGLINIPSPNFKRLDDQRRKAELLININKEILKNPEENELSGSWRANYARGLGNGQWHDYAPFVSGIVDIADAGALYKIAKKAKRIATAKETGEEATEWLTTQESMILKMYSMKGQSDRYAKELGKDWNGYNAGKLTREMIPYIGEFILTSVVFTATRTAARQALTKALLGKSDDVVRRQLGSKVLRNEFKTKTGKSLRKLSYNRKVINATSWLLGTAAQASANPQHYVKETIRFMTPQTMLMLSDEGNSLVGAVDANTGEGFASAFKKGFLLTWAEFATERMGELLPGLGKYIRKDIMKDPGWMKRLLLGHWLRKNGWTKAAAINHFRKQKMGWHGFSGEMFEEIINLPLSNLITGRPAMEGLDKSFLIEMGQAIGVTSLAFGGVSLATMDYTGATQYLVNNEKYETATEFFAEIDRLIASGAMSDVNQEVNIRIDNDFISTEALDKMLDYKKFQDKNNNITTNEGSLAEAIVASEIEIAAGATTEENSALQENEEELEELQDKRAAIKNDPKIKGEKKKKLLNEAQRKIDLAKAVQTNMVGIIRERVEAGKRKDFYLDRLKKAKRLARKSGLDVKWEIGTTAEQAVEKLAKDINRQVKELSSALNATTDPKKQKEIQKEIDSLIAMSMGVDAEGKPLPQGKTIFDQIRKSHGVMSQDGKVILINEEFALSKEGGNINVGAHEFLHRAMLNTLKQNPNMQLAVGKALHEYIMNLDPRKVANSKFRNRLLAYHSNQDKLIELGSKYKQQRHDGDYKAAEKTKAEFLKLEKDFNAEQAEEVLTLLSDAIYYGEIIFSENLFTKLGDIFRRILRHMGIKATFSTGRDVFNFIRDYNRSIEKGKLSEGMMRTLVEGADIKGEIAKAAKPKKKAKPKAKPKKKYKASLPAITQEQKADMFRDTRLEVDNLLKSGMAGKVIGFKGHESFFDMPMEQQKDIWRNQLSEENRKLIGYMIGSTWKNWIAKLADEKYDRIPGWQGFRPEFLDRITQGLEAEDNGLPFLVNTWLQDVEEGVKPATLTSHIFGNLPLRMPHTTRTIAGFGEVLGEYQEQEDYREEESGTAGEMFGQNEFRGIIGIETNSELYNNIKDFSAKELVKIDFAKALAVDAKEKDRLKAQKEFRQLLAKKALKFRNQVKDLVGTQKSDKFKEHLGKVHKDIPRLLGAKYTTRFKGKNSLVEKVGEMNTDQSITSQVSMEGSFVTNKYAGNDIWVPKEMTLQEIMAILVEGADTQYKAYIDALTTEVFIDSMFEVIEEQGIQNAITHAGMLSEAIKRNPAYMFSKGGFVGLAKLPPLPTTDKVSKDILETLKISLQHDWGSEVWREEVDKAGVDAGSINYMESEGYDRYFAENTSGFKTPLQEAREKGNWNEEVETILEMYFADVMNKVSTKAKEQMAQAMSALINILPPQLVRKLGKPFFGLIGSDRIFGGKNFRYQWLIDQYEEKASQPDIDVELDFDVNAVEILNANMGLMLAIQKVLALNIDADVKESQVDKTLGTRIDGANINNPKALKYIMNQVLAIKLNPNINAEVKAGLTRWMELASNNTRAQRGLTRLGAIQYHNGSQAPFVGLNEKGEVVKYFAKKPNQAEIPKNVKSVIINTAHPDYKAALESASDIVGKKLTENKPNIRHVWQNEAILNNWMEEQVEAAIAERLRFKGEHVQPSANTMREVEVAGFNTMTATSNNPENRDALIESFNNKYDKIVSEFYQTLGSEVYSYAQDHSALLSGTTSEANTVRLLALEKVKNLKLSSFRGAEPSHRGLQGTAFVQRILTNEKSIEEYRGIVETLKADSDGDMKTFQILGKAYMFSRSANPHRGISIWDFDDTVARTKSGARAKIPNPSMTPKPGRKVIFLAGGAGSGKSNVVRQLGLEEQGFKIVNQDISLEWLKKNHGLPEDMRDLTREQMSTLGKLQWEARRIAARKQAKFKGKGDGIIVDGTGASMKVMQKQVAEFIAAGYDVQMLFVETSLEIALERNRLRKERSLKDIIVRKNHEAVQANKVGFKELFGGNFAEINTDNLQQNDPMPSKLIDQLGEFTKGYENRRLTADEFATEGSTILSKGGTFDFTEFDVVAQGETGPLFGAAINRAKKFGTRHQFILTARPHAAKEHIYEFLKSQGLDIPLENIITLENSTSDAKALWIAEKVGEGYNDIYFADDHLENVDAVKNLLAQFDVKSKVQQAKYKFSKNANKEFNTILEQTTGMDAKKVFSQAKAKKRGAKPKFRFFIPPSAEDFKGLLYQFLTKGELGENQMAWFKENLLNPFARGYRELNTAKQVMATDYKALKKAMPAVVALLGEKVPGSEFTYEDAIRTYLFTEAGHDMVDYGLSKKDVKNLVKTVETSHRLKSFADILSGVVKRPEGYVPPNEFWLVGSITSDIHDATSKIGRKEFLAQWVQNKNEIFSEANLNKIEALYGTSFRSALEDMLWRMEHGTNRTFGDNKLVNGFQNWLNNSVGAIMFFNMRSAVLQTLSTVNFINWSDNNMARAAAAFANQPQFWKDFSFLFNSDMLKQRRTGLKTDINAAELTQAISKSKNKVASALNWLLQKGFLPTQIADSFAIASGGATFYRNRVKSYIKQGLSQEEAEKKAFIDFQEIAEETQQSSRPDMISQQQASALGRIILAFQNTPMQYMRLSKKAMMDLAAGRGDAKTHISKIVYYTTVQNLIFYSLQSALFALAFDDDDDSEISKSAEKKKQRVLNGMLDTVLRGTGIYGAIVSTIKNVIIKFGEQEQKTWNKDYSAVLVEALNLSPPLGSKARKLVSAQKTWNYNKDVIKHMDWYDLDNPTWQAFGNVVSATTNVPLDRLVNKTLNMREALNDDNAAWQRIALALGWNRWDLGVQSQEINRVKDIIKIERKEVKTKLKLEEKYPDKTESEIKLLQKGEEVYKLKKNEQVRILKRLGLKDKDISALKLEKNRVDKIMELYKKDSDKVESALKYNKEYKPTKQEQRSEELFKMKKEDQVNTLLEYGLKPKQIRALKYEKDRVNKIIELENKKKKK